MNRRHQHSETNTLVQESDQGFLRKYFSKVFLEEELISLILEHQDRLLDIDYQLVEERLEAFSRYNNLNPALKLIDLSLYLTSIEGVTVEQARQVKSVIERVVGEKASSSSRARSARKNRQS